MVDQPWDPNDKQWLKARKANWKKIKESIKKHFYFVESYQISGLRDYYLTGEENDLFLETSGQLLFKLWLHPDQSEERWNGIWQDLLTKFKGHAHARDISFVQSREYFFSVSSDADRKCDPDFGVFGGAEERLVKFFVPIDKYTDETMLIENRPVKLSYWHKPEILYFAFTGNMMSFLVEEDYNIYNPYQYLINLWHSSLNTEMEFDQRDFNFSKKFYQAVVSEKNNETLYENKKVFIKNMTELLDTKPLPNFIEEVWEDAKKATD